ncbi:hypothetical protein AA313_de0207980 [Arthrobotrys entomopaga]|nr:hypothetical protein AA313_de0207980 [Arthrobotrys entomopaga]
MEETAHPWVLAGIEVHQGDNCMDPDPAFVEFPTDQALWNQNPQVHAAYLEENLFHEMMNPPSFFENHVNGIQGDDEDGDESFNIHPFELHDDDFLEHFEEYEEPLEPDYDYEGSEKLKKRNTNPEPVGGGSGSYDVSDEGSIDPRLPPQGLGTNNDNPDAQGDRIDAEEEMSMEELDAFVNYPDELPFAGGQEPGGLGSNFGIGQSQNSIATAQPVDVLPEVDLDPDFTDLPILEINMLQHNFRFTANTSIRFISDYTAWHRPAGVVQRFLELPDEWVDISSDSDDDDGYNIHAAAAAA